MPPFAVPPATPELVLRTSGNSGPQLARDSSRKRVTPEAQALFLDHLAASCNVAWAAAQAGFSAQTFYKHRRTDPELARLWEEALDVGCVRLKTELLGTAIDFIERLRSDSELPLKHMTVRDAMTLINRHGPGDPANRRGRFKVRPRSLDEVRDSILGKLEAIEAMRRVEAAEGASGCADEPGHGPDGGPDRGRDSGEA